MLVKVKNSLAAGIGVFFFFFNLPLNNFYW